MQVFSSVASKEAAAMPFLRSLKLPFLAIMIPTMAYRFTRGARANGHSFGCNLKASSKWVIGYIPGGVPAGVQALRAHLQQCGCLSTEA